MDSPYWANKKKAVVNCEKSLLCTVTIQSKHQSPMIPTSQSSKRSRETDVREDFTNTLKAPRRTFSVIVKSSCTLPLFLALERRDHLFISPSLVFQRQNFIFHRNNSPTIIATQKRANITDDTIYVMCMPLLPDVTRQLLLYLIKMVHFVPNFKL